jgi:hypothetical protein
MKSSLKLISAMLLSGALALPALAQVGTAPPIVSVPPNMPANPNPAGYDKRHPYAHHFGEFLEKHPGIQGDLERDPALIHDPAYLKAHPELRAYLERHPGVDEAFRAHPDQFMKRVNRTEGQ